MLAAQVHAQDAAVPAGEPAPVAESIDQAIGPSEAIETAASHGPLPAGPLKVLSWNVASSPYAIAMRKIKSATPSWRTSFGSERRTIEAPMAPQAADIDADVVLLQGITNPRAMRRLFPARKWRIVFPRRALAALPKGSVFTAPVSSVEVEAVAIRLRQGLRLVGRDDHLDAAPVTQALAASPPTDVDANAPGVAVKVLDRGKPLWLASISIGGACSAPEPCDATGIVMRWREARLKSGEATIAGGRLRAGEAGAPCAAQAIESEAPAATAPSLGKGELRPLFGCVAELTVP
jgi:hypothetical protein